MHYRCWIKWFTWTVTTTYSPMRERIKTVWPPHNRVKWEWLPHMLSWDRFHRWGKRVVDLGEIKARELKCQTPQRDRSGQGTEEGPPIGLDITPVNPRTHDTHGRRGPSVQHAASKKIHQTTLQHRSSAAGRLRRKRRNTRSTGDAGKGRDLVEIISSPDIFRVEFYWQKRW